MNFRPSRGFHILVCLAGVLLSQTRDLPGETGEQGSSVSADEAARRLQFLKSVEAKTPPQATPALIKKRFAESRGPTVRLEEAPPSAVTPPVKPPAETAATAPAKAPHLAETRANEPSAKSTAHLGAKTPTPHHPNTATADLAEARAAEPHAKSTPAVETRIPPAHAATPSVNTIAETHPAEPRAKSTPAVEAKPPVSHPAPIAVGPTPGKLVIETRIPPAHAATPSPAPVAVTHSAEPRTKSTPAVETKPPVSHPAPIAAGPTPGKVVASLHHPEPPPPTKPLSDIRIVDTRPLETPRPRPPATHAELASNRYPWKLAIVTTVFWIGEPVGGNNFTPNCSSSWDANWTRSYGGYDNPHPESRRNFLPVNFTPHQNPFYVALPYNDVTRGTTKPEARVVIPWFREAFHKEGESVCHNRWIVVRNRAGRVAYAQWSDCGPFRTDHWQYVFGMDRPKPNLNQGAGLDVSPALRDYLGLQSTDVTDWKFVDTRDVPNGPWVLYGDNNPFAQRRSRVTEVNAGSIDLAANRTH